MAQGGDALLLRGGAYREQVYCAVAGKVDAPITIRAHPGERVILDGGFAAFFEEPASAWEPVKGGAAEEYPQEHDINVDGNLHWRPAPGAKLPEGFLEKVRDAKGSKAVRTKYPAGWEAGSFVGDPRFAAFVTDPANGNDYRLGKDSPAIGKGVVLPKELPDPLRPANGAKPDIGAIPTGGDVPAVGRQGRVKSPSPGKRPLE